MTAATAHVTVNSLFYSAAATIIRYIFIRSSYQPNIQEVLKRDAFVYKSMFIVESLGCYNLITFFLLQRGKRGSEKCSVLLYQSCLDPWKSSFSTPFFKVMSSNLLLVFIAAFCIIFFNIKLYTHLDKNSRSNTALSTTTDQVISLVTSVKKTNTIYCMLSKFFLGYLYLQVKSRRRNIVSAHVGMYSLCFSVIFGPIQMALYSLPIDLGKSGSVILCSMAWECWVNI